MSHVNYAKNYASQLMRGKDITTRPPLTVDIAIQLDGANKKILDIGCGTAQKTLQLAEKYQLAIGLEPSQDLLQIAHNNIKAANRRNCHLAEGVSQSIPFKERTFDVVTAILSWWDATEVHRVLQPNGVFLIECLGQDDKTTFTRYFGKDDKGWRGANLNTSFAGIKQDLEARLSPYFKIIEIYNQSWQTEYTKEGLWLLLNNTVTTVRQFDTVLDKTTFDYAVQQCEINQWVVLTQNRLVVVAAKG